MVPRSHNHVAFSLTNTFPTGRDTMTRVSDDEVEVAKSTRKMPVNYRTVDPKPGDLQRKRATDDMEMAKVKVLGYIRQGMHPTAAMEAVGRSGKTFYTWTRKSTKFRHAAAAAVEAWNLAQVKADMPYRERMDEFEPILRENYKTWSEYVVAHRKAYFGYDTFDHQWMILNAWENSPPGGISLILVPPEGGKALALDTPIPTPSGFTRMGELAVGDQVLGSNGRPCTVTYVSPVFTGNRCFEVMADDGASVIADADHLWAVRVSQDKSSGSAKRRGWKASVKIKTTLELTKTRSKRPCLQMSSALDFPRADLPIDPYVLGVWLGDGASAGGRIYSADDDAIIIRERFEASGYPTRDVSGDFAWSVPGLQTKLRALGVLNAKKIPMAYLRSSIEQRLALLQGLIDTDGYVEKNGQVEFTSINAALASATLELVRSLGVKASLAEGRATLCGRDISAKYRVTFFKADAAYLPRKRELCKDGTRRPSRYLEAREVPSVPTRCIAVDATDHLYLAGEGYLVTHNTTLLLDAITADLCANPNMRVALISEGQDFARKALARIQRRMIVESGPPPPLFEHFGPFQPLATSNKKWNSDEFTLLASTHDEQDPSCISVGITGNIRGTRWNRVYLDDVQSVRNESATPRLMRIFRGDVIPRPGKMGRINITGSRVGRNDFYSELERVGIVDEVICLPALNMSKPVGFQSYFPRQFRKEILEDGTEVDVPIVNESGEPMGWSDADMAQRRSKVGEDEWQRVYMQAPQSEHSAMVTDGDIVNATDAGQNAKPPRVVGQTPPSAVSTLAGLDPALANHAAFTYCGYDADCLYVIDVIDMYKPTTNKKIFDEIRRGTVRYKPDWWIIENNTLQSGYLNDDVFLEMRNKYGFQAVSHHTGAEKTTPNLGVPALMQAIVRGEVRFPMIKDTDTDFALLFDQLKAWRPDVPTKRLVQDMVMSLWFCYLRWRVLRDRIDTSLVGWKRDALSEVTDYPWARSNLRLPEEEKRPVAPETYEQAWDRVKGQGAA
jgi:hypothetical protein